MGGAGVARDGGRARDDHRAPDTRTDDIPMSPTRASLLFTTLALGVAACGAPADTAAPAPVSAADVTVVADDMRFVAPPATLAAGTTVVALDNVDGAPHDLTVEGVDGATIGARGGEAEAGELTLESGTYTVYCSVGGHREAGMEFTLTVS
jgi:plastocyanin